MKNFYNLNFFKTPLKDNFVFPELTEENFKRQGWYLWHYFDNQNFDFINPKIAIWADQHSLKINHCHLFCGPPNTTSIIHCDGPPEAFQFGINWVLTGLDSYMAWYDVDDINKTTDTNISGSRYRHWTVEEAREIERCSLVGPTLVNAHVPHNIVNNSSENRWTASLRFSHDFKTWPQVVDYFDSYILK